MTYAQLTEAFLKICTAVSAACVLACLIRTVIGPRISDRLIGVNMTGTQVTGMIAMICVISGETGFIDIAMIYALLSFISAAVLTGIIERRKDGK